MIGSGGGYHKERGEGFTDKLSALAKFAGITALAIGSAPNMGRSLGRLGQSFAKDLMDNAGIARRLVGKAIGVEDAGNLFFDNFNFLAESIPRVKRIAYSGKMYQLRRNAVLDALRSEATDADAFARSEDSIAEALSGLFHGVEKKNVDSLLSDSLYKRFQESTKGSQFRFMQEAARDSREGGAEQRAALARKLADALEAAERNRAGVSSDKILSAGLDPDQGAPIMAAIREHMARTRATEDRVLGGLGLDQLRHITVGDLADKRTSEAVRRYMQRIGTPDVDYHTRAANAVQELFGGDGGLAGGREGLRNEFQALVNAQRTGLVLDEHGEVYSIAHAGNTARNVAARALEQLQIPLVPFKFNIPLTSGRFLLPSRDAVKDVGRLALQGEMRRTGSVGSLGADSFGIAIGNRVIAFDDDAVRLVNGRFTFANTAASERVHEFARGRGKMGGSMIEEFESDLHEHGVVGAVQRFLRAGGDPRHNILRQTLFNRQNELFDLTYEGGSGFSLLPKHGDLGAAAAMGSLGRLADVAASEIHPELLRRYVASNGVDSLPGTIASDVYRRLFQEGAASSQDASVGLGRIASALGGRISYGAEAESALGLKSKILRLMGASGDPSKLLSELVRDDGKGSLLDDFEKTRKYLGPELGKALAAVSENKGRLYEVGRDNGGLISKTSADILGDPTLSYLHLQVQQGLLSEAVRGLGIGEVERASGRSIEETVVGLFSAGVSDPGLDSVRTMLSKAHGFDESLVNRLAGSIIGTPTDPGEVSRQELGALVAPLVDLKTISRIVDDASTTAKIAEAARADSVLAAFKADRAEASSRLLTRLYEDGQVAEAVISRQGPLGAGFHMDAPPSEVPRFYGFSTGASADPNLSVVERLEEQVRRYFGADGFLQSLYDPDKPMSHAAFALTTLMHTPQHVGALVGLGVPEEEATTLLRSVASFGLRRVLPAYVGLELYKNFNADAHRAGLPGVDDAGANLLANAGLGATGLADSLGLTAGASHLVHSIPGLDQYFNPRSEDQYREDLFYGDEYVRRGRFFMIGSRGQLTGGAVEYTRPGFYRRWKSHWTEAENAQISNPDYSFLPTVSNPLAPISRLAHPHYAQELTQFDRPYASMREIREFLGSNDYGAYFPNAPAGSDGSFVGFASFGAGLPTSTRAAAVPEGGIPLLPAAKDAYAAGGGGEGGGAPVPYGPGGGGGGGGGGTNQLGNAYYEPGAAAIRIANRKDIPPGALRMPGLGGMIPAVAEDASRHMGFYGGVARLMPFFPEEGGAIDIQSPHSAFGANRLLFGGDYGELTGPAGEFYRRFMHEDAQSYDAFNPMPNSMPTYVPERFKMGDPYMRTPGHGELNLPGDAYERANPYTKPMRARGSMIGLSKEEIVAKMLDPVGAYESDDGAEDIMQYGTTVHKLVMQRLRGAGMLIGAEVPGYDEAHNISATIDAIVQGEGGPEVVEIKTRGTQNFFTDPDKYIDQLMFYMYLTGTKSGVLAHVNRDDPKQVRFARYAYDPERMQRVFDRVEAARDEIRELVANGMVSPYETYDLLARIEILAKVAPDSSEFREYVRHASENGGFGGMEQKRFEKALETAKVLREDYNLYPYRRASLQTKNLMVDAVTDEGEIVTRKGTIKLAGVKFDEQAFSLESAEEVLAKYGVKVGQSIPVTLLRGQFNDDVMSSTTMEAIVGGVNKSILNSRYGLPDTKARGPLASRVLGRTGLADSIFENVLHSDNMVASKFMRVRSPLEQFKRGEVYGSDDYNYRDIMGNYVVPTVNSIASKNPIVAAAQGGIVASLFVRGREAKTKVAMAAAGVAAVASLLREGYETMSGEPYKTSRYRKQTEFDEYWDALKFIKESSIAEAARNKALDVEGVDVRKLEESEKRMRVHAGAFTAMAIDAERRARKTMYGFDVASGTLQEAISAIPDRHRQIAEQIVLNGSLPEKREFYNLLPDHEKRVLGKFLGVSVDALPDNPRLAEYFKQHYLPEVDWAGWGRGADMEDLKVRAAEAENLRIDRPNRMRVAKAKAYTEGVAIPRMDSPTTRSVFRELQRIIASGDLGPIRASYSATLASRNVIDVRMRFREARQETNQEIESQLSTSF